MKENTWSSVVQMNEDSKHGVFGVGEVVEVLMPIETVFGKSVGLETSSQKLGRSASRVCSF